MTDQKDERPTPGGRRTEEALRAAARPQAEPEFRARLKHEFTSGRLAERAPAGREVVAAGVTNRIRLWWGRPAIRLAFATAAVAAVVAVAALNRGGGWELASVEGSGTVMIDGAPVSLADWDQLRQRVRPGVRVVIPTEGEFTLIAGRALALQLTRGTVVTIPAPPARWFNRSSRIDMHAGEVRISTGPRFRGARFAVRTPLASAEVTGTTIAVILDSAYTCVCVLEGVAKVEERSGQTTALAAGMRRFLYRDQSPSLLESLDDMQRMKLTMFRDATRHALTNEQ